MRAPSPTSALREPYHAALAGADNYSAGPFVGWFRMRMVRGGPWVAVRFFIERDIDPTTGELTNDEVFVCEVGGERRDPDKTWERINWPPISRAAHDALEAANQIDPAMAATHAPVDLSAAPTRPR